MANVETRTQREAWEADDRTAGAWMEVWEHVRAVRISGATEEWAHTDDAWLVASRFADAILGDEAEDEDGNPTAEWEDAVDKCIAEIASLL